MFMQCHAGTMQLAVSRGEIGEEATIWRAGLISHDNTTRARQQAESLVLWPPQLRAISLDNETSAVKSENRARRI